MKNSKNILIIILFILLGIITWGIHTGKHKSIKEHLKKYHECIMEKYEDTKTKIREFFNKQEKKENS